MRGGKKCAARRLAFLAASLFLVFTLLPATAARARDLVVYGEPTLQSALIAVGSLWRSRGGVRVHVFVAPTALSLAQIERGARCDVIVGMAEPLADGERRKLIDSETKAPLFRNA